jgi:hypothetical protein
MKSAASHCYSHILMLAQLSRNTPNSLPISSTQSRTQVTPAPSLDTGTSPSTSSPPPNHPAPPRNARHATYALDTQLASSKPLSVRDDGRV